MRNSVMDAISDYDSEDKDWREVIDLDSRVIKVLEYQNKRKNLIH